MEITGHVTQKMLSIKYRQFFFKRTVAYRHYNGYFSQKTTQYPCNWEARKGFSVKIKRNQPCPCGSGKKYKKCCLIKQNIVPASDLAYRRLSDAYKRLEIKLEAFLSKQCGEEGVTDGLDEFFCWPEDDETAFIESVFEEMQDLYRPWLLYNWEFDEDNEDITGLFGTSISQAYLKEHENKLNNDEKHLIKAISHKPYCFWEVVRVTPGREMDIKNIITDQKITIVERTMTTQIKPKNIIFSRAVIVDGIGMLIGAGSILIPYRLKPALIELRKKIGGDQLFATDQDLAEWDLELRQWYLDFYRHMHNPPALSNTDGDPLEAHKLIYTIDDPEAVFTGIVPLCSVESEEDLRSEALTDDDNKVLEADFPWTKQGNKKMPEWDNTVLGEISISQDNLSIKVNSVERAKKIQKEIKKRLGRLAKFQMDVIENIEEMLARKMDEQSDTQEKSMSNEELLKFPEARQLLEQTIFRHWEHWADIPVPALGNKTPRNAVKTEEGREAVEALLYDAVTSSPEPVMKEMNEKGVRLVCKELGLELSQ